MACAIVLVSWPFSPVQPRHYYFTQCLFKFTAVFASFSCHHFFRISDLHSWSIFSEKSSCVSWLVVKIVSISSVPGSSVFILFSLFQSSSRLMVLLEAITRWFFFFFWLPLLLSRDLLSAKWCPMVGIHQVHGVPSYPMVSCLPFSVAVFKIFLFWFSTVSLTKSGRVFFFLIIYPSQCTSYLQFYVFPDFCSPFHTLYSPFHTSCSVS